MRVEDPAQALKREPRVRACFFFLFFFFLAERDLYVYLLFAVVAWSQCLWGAQRRKKDRFTAGAMCTGRHLSTASH